MAKSYIYDILQWNPINTHSFNLLAVLKIKPDVKLLNLFKVAPLHNILCRISGTNSEYDNKLIYGKIDKSTEDDSYYITLDQVWKSYPDLNKQGKIEFMADTVYKTIDYLENPNASSVINTDNFNTPTLNLLYNNSEDNAVHPEGSSSAPLSRSSSVPSSSSPFSVSTEPQFCSNPRMKLPDMLIPIGISLIIIGLMMYIFPKKFFN
jgi:hypothetical protein